MKLINDFRKTPVLRLLFPFIVGVIIAIYSAGSDLPGILFFIIPVIIAGMLLFFQAESVFGRLFFAVCVGFIAALAGYLNTKTSMPANELTIDNENVIVRGTVRDFPEQAGNSYRICIGLSCIAYGGEIQNLKQDMLVYVPKTTSDSLFIPGEIWVFCGKIQKIRNRGNSREFDYRSFVNRKDLFYNLFADEDRYEKVGSEKMMLRYLPLHLRRKLIHAWGSDSQGAVLSAITLGAKSYLEDDVKDSFSDAGAMHLLAVSGLHVGMIWWLLDLLIRIPGRGRYIQLQKIFIILFILWFYAACTGFSESVTRSVMMFSVVSVSRSLQRKTNIYQTIGLSALILLVIRPIRILDPGFQLSYTAVLGIVSIYPLMKAVWYPNHKFSCKIYDLVFVSIAAQLATLPLTLLYFHKFPVWFILTNLLSIPVVSVILCAFIILIPFLLVFPANQVAVKILTFLAEVLNRIVSAVSDLPFSTIRNIPMEQDVMAGLFLAMFLLIFYFYYRRLFFMNLGLVVLVFAIVLSCFKRIPAAGEATYEIANFNDASIVTYTDGKLRETYTLENDTVLNRYTSEYIEKLSYFPVSVRRHVTRSLNYSEFPEIDGVYILEKQLWACNPGNCKVLVAGACDSGIFELVLQRENWDVVILRTGFPVFKKCIPTKKTDMKFVGDGTLNVFETGYLRVHYPEIHLCRDRGAFSFSGKISEL